MAANKNAGMSEKERALIEEARRMLAAGTSARNNPEARRVAPRIAPHAAPSAAAAAVAKLPPVVAEPAQPAKPPPKIDAAARIAAMMQAEREETERRRRQLRWWGIYLPLSVTTLAVLWIAITMVR